MMQDRVLAGVLLSELKQAVLQYMKAALEATSAEVRRTFEQLAYDTVRQYEQLKGMMELNRMAVPAAAASIEEVRREAARGEAVRREAMQGRNQRLFSAPMMFADRQAPAGDGAAPRPPELMLPHNGGAEALTGGSASVDAAAVSEPEAKEEKPPKASSKRGRKKAEPEPAQE